MWRLTAPVPYMGGHQRHPGMIALSENTNKETAEMRSGHLQMSFQLWQISEKRDELSAHI